MIDLNKVKRFNKKDRTVLIRFDLNVPLDSEELHKSERIIRIKKSILKLTSLNSKIIILSHVGRPKGTSSNDLSLKQLIEPLKKALNKDIEFISDCIGVDVKNKISETDSSKIILLENCRFYSEEEANDDGFAESLSQLADVYINDAFACSHRAHASISAITKYLPSYCGELLYDELLNLNKIITDPDKPAITIMGGSKISTKISIVKNLAKKMSAIAICGGMANSFLEYQGFNIGKSLAEKNVQNIIQDIFNFSAENSCKIILPQDANVALKIENNVSSNIKKINQIDIDEMILDIGPVSIKELKEQIKSSKTVFWNGPPGVFEVSPFNKASIEIAEYIAELTQAGKIQSFAGGGDTVAAIEMAGVKDKFTYISTGGGALLELLEGKQLPGLASQNIL
ncbi:MAG: phosphoglycerate kinase [Candidatus Pelagibacterales bacterium]|jgi:phosphoglycerate kinase|nr:phosphoglycerate kinase [Pelagibacterales bacterium]MDA7764134.1 phosphoglycerate kinase [Pelagibacterales bacterium]|tara:strand:- start:507 stop:1703 length:1197 start_codon:yes stop_codon:yes gene_type:complete